MISRKSILAVSCCGVMAVGVAACGGSDSTGSSGGGGDVSGDIAGAGATSQEAAQEAWKANFESQNSGVTIAYDPVGSGGGREQFEAGGVDFAGTDSSFADEELTKAEKVCGGADNFVQVPAYISPIAIIYNLQGVDNLQLSPDTIAGIFAQDITTWNDPAIAKDNPGVDLPSTRITPVNRSDDSGTTSNFTDYLSAVAPEVWTDKASGVWPSSLKGENAKGTSGVVKTVTDTPGAVTYADDSAVSGKLGTAQIKVGDSFVKISPEAASKAVDQGKPVEGRNANDLAIKLDRKTTVAGAYPIVLVSYHIVCTTYDTQATADLVKAFVSYAASDAGQKAAADSAKSAPLSAALQGKVKTALEAVKGKA